MGSTKLSEASRTCNRGTDVGNPGVYGPWGQNPKIGNSKNGISVFSP